MNTRKVGLHHDGIYWFGFIALHEALHWFHTFLQESDLVESNGMMLLSTYEVFMCTLH